MKRQSNKHVKEKYIFLACLVFLSIGSGFAQNDTVYIIKTDTVFMPQKQDLMYKQFVENKEQEIKHLWKLNWVDLGSFRPNLAYQQRIGKSLSVEGYASYNLSKYFSFNGSSISYPTFEFEQMFKYYFDTKIRERKGLITNGFSGNYIATSIISNQTKWEQMSNYAIDTKTNLNIGFKYGYQRRIGSFAYIEFSAGLYYNYKWEKMRVNQSGIWYSGMDSKILPFVGFRGGFAIDSFKNLHSRIKQ
jgi:hypothetical protein